MNIARFRVEGLFGSLDHDIPVHTADHALDGGGHLTVLHGANGVGKTTVLQMMAGLFEPSARVWRLPFDRVTVDLVDTSNGATSTLAIEGERHAREVPERGRLMATIADAAHSHGFSRIEDGAAPERLELFQRIVERKQLLNKTLCIEPAQERSLDIGDKALAFQGGRRFAIKGRDGQVIPSLNLSSGERSMLGLFHDIVFRCAPFKTVLIDAPETDMHVAWKRQFLKDIEEIAALTKQDFVVATHSPTIAGNWRFHAVPLTHAGSA